MIGEYRNGNMTGPAYTHELKTDKWVYAIFKSYLVETEYTFYTNNVTTGCVAGDCQTNMGVTNGAMGIALPIFPKRQHVDGYRYVCFGR